MRFKNDKKTAWMVSIFIKIHVAPKAILVNQEESLLCKKIFIPVPFQEEIHAGHLLQRHCDFIIHVLNNAAAPLLLFG